MVTAKVKQWDPLVTEELATAKVPLPNELILRLIQKESGGNVGAVRKGGSDSGLMQVIPNTLKDYNLRHGTKYTIDDLRGKDTASARIQIRVGIGVISHYWRRAYKYMNERGVQDIDIDDLAHIADLFYRAGPGATMAKLNTLPSLTWQTIDAAFTSEEWPPMKHPRSMFKTPVEFNVGAIEKWLQSGYKAPIPTPTPKIPDVDPKTGFALGILLLMAAYWLMKGKS